MNYKKRILTDRLHRLVEHFSVLVLSGARQVGKSTLLKHEFGTWDTVVFDPVIDVGNARSDPEMFLRNHPAPLILDEIQYCPEIVPCIKRHVDEEKKPGMYILTGSQQWAVIKTISESLAGRAVFLDLEGFSIAELAEAETEESWFGRYLDDPAGFVAGRHPRISSKRTLYEHLWRGFLPEIDSLPEDLAGDFFSAYLRTYIERDVRLILQVDDWQQFGRFVQLAAALTAQELNYSQLGREIGITPQTAKRWIGVLAACFQWFETPAFHGNSIKKISSKAKGYFADTGLACSLLHISSPKALGGHPSTGSLFETAVFAEIRKLNSTLKQKANIYHWRLHSGNEVDLIIERDGVLHPMEIKLTTRPKKNDGRGIQSLRMNYPNLKIAPGLVISASDSFEQLSDLEYIAPWDML